jgi:preprotein translocase subunit YajC
MALLLPLIVVAAFFLLRANPQRRRAQAQKALVESLHPGVRVATVAGVIGTLVGTEGDRAAIEIAPGVIVEFLLAAITRTIEDPEEPPDGIAEHLDAASHAEGAATEGDDEAAQRPEET